MADSEARLKGMDSSSLNRIVLYTAHTYLDNLCIRMDENKILFGKHIPGTYQVYSWRIYGTGIYTWYIPGIYLVYQEKTIRGFQMIRRLRRHPREKVPTRMQITWRRIPPSPLPLPVSPGDRASAQ